MIKEGVFLVFLYFHIIGIILDSSYGDGDYLTKNNKYGIW